METELYLPSRILGIPSGCLCRYLFFLHFPYWWCRLVVVRSGLCCRFGLFRSIGRAYFIRRIIFGAVRISSFLDCMETE